VNHIAEQPSNVIFKTSEIDPKIYVREQKGFYQKIRRSLNILLMSVFIVIPLIQHNGHQAILFDLEKQTLTCFSTTLYPHDLLILGLIFIVAAFSLFYVTRLYGRIWCGYTCPQTIWMLMFNWIERRIEGSHNQSKLLDNAKMSMPKAVKKITKHLIWTVLSLFTALIFISYFVPANQLYANFFTFQASSLTVSWVIFFAACTYINGGWIKDKMCLHICPYSRFQSVMFSQTTSLITYDALRGESRGPRKRTQPKPENKGDCVDCNLCVQVCPVGIDIREGLQYECINCGLCADACNAVMDKFNYAKGLIKYTSESTPSSSWKQHIGYGLIIGLLGISLVTWFFERSEFEVSVIRDRHTLYRINDMGKVENTYTIKTLNKSQYARTYQVNTINPERFKIAGNTQFTIKPGEHYLNIISVTSNQHLDEKINKISFIVTNKKNSQNHTLPTVFFND